MQRRRPILTPTSVTMVMSKDDICSRQPRPQMVRSKSVGASTGRSHGPADSRQHKKKPYSSSTKFKAVERLSRDRSIVKGSNLSEESSDYSNRSFLPLPAQSPRNSLFLSTESLKENGVPILLLFDGQEGGELGYLYSELDNFNVMKHNLQETVHNIRAESLPSGLMQMANLNPELFSSENADNTCQDTMEEAPLSRRRDNVRRSRKPLTACNLQDNQLNPQRTYVGNATDSHRVGQSEACQHKHCTHGQMVESGVDMSQQFNYDENMTHETILRCFASTEGDRNDCEADHFIESPTFGDQFLDSAQQNTPKWEVTPIDDEGGKFTDDVDILGCSDDDSHQFPSSLRRQDTLLLHQDSNIGDDDNNDDDEGFESIFESLKPFLCCEVPDDSDIFKNNDEYHEIINCEDEPDEERGSYKNLLNCSPRYQCSLCDSDLEMAPFQQQEWGGENEFFHFFVRQGSTSQADLYCPQCCCTRSTYCPQ